MSIIQVMSHLQWGQYNSSSPDFYILCTYIHKLYKCKGDHPCMIIYIYGPSSAAIWHYQLYWLVVSILWKIWVSWDYYTLSFPKYRKMFQTTNQPLKVDFPQLLIVFPYLTMDFGAFPIHIPSGNQTWQWKIDHKNRWFS